VWIRAPFLIVLVLLVIVTHIILIRYVISISLFLLLFALVSQILNAGRIVINHHHSIVVLFLAGILLRKSLRS